METLLWGRVAYDDINIYWENPREKNIILGLSSNFNLSEGAYLNTLSKIVFFCGQFPSSYYAFPPS